MSEQVELELKLKGGDNAVKTLGQLERELDKAREAIKEVEVGSDAFNKLATQIQNASSEVKTLEKQMEGLEPQQKTEAFLKLGEGVAGGFAMAQGAMGLMGVESENLEKIQVKVQSAIAIAQGARMMSEAALMFTTAKRVAMEKIALIQTKLFTVVNKAAALGALLYARGLGSVGLAAKTTTKGMRVLKLAIMSTGIGLLVVAIGTIAVYWDDIKSLVSGVTKEMKEQLASATATKDAALNTMEANEGSVNQLKLQGKSQKEILKIRLEDVKAAITASEIELQRQKATKDAQVATAKRNKDILLGLLKFLMVPMDAIVSLYNEIVYYIPEVEAIASPSEWLTGKIFDPEATKVEVDATTNEMEKGINTLKEKYAGLQLNLRDLNKSGTTNRTDDTKAQNEEDLKELDRFLEELQATYDEHNQTAKEKEINAIRDKYERLIKEAEKYGLDTTDLKEIQEAKLAEIEERYRKEKAEKDAEVSEDEQKRIDALADFKASVDTQGFALAKELGGKNKKIQKGIAVSETIFNTQKAVMRALADIPAPFGAIQAGIHGAMGAFAIRNILSESMGDVSAGGGGGTSPEPMLPASTGAFSLGNVEQQPMKAFVVESEITDSQAQMSDINRRSTI